jgi:microcystin-dependent protein
MTLRWLHHFVTAKADGTNVTLVKPTNWNEPHDATTDSTVPIVVGATVPGPLVELPISTIMPTGVMVPYAGAVAPAGWYLCDGSLKNRITDAGLFAVCGTTYGAGDSSTTFQLPDMRGRVPAGVDGGAGRLTSTWFGNAVLGAAGGTQANSTTVGFTSSGTNAINFGNVNLIGGYSSPSGAEVAAASSGNGASARAHDHSVSGYVSLYGNFGISVYGSGGTAGFLTAPPTLITNYIIKA